MSGILPTISKWFSREEIKSTIRYRDEDDEDANYDDDDMIADNAIPIQPPTKKLKLPTANEAVPTFRYNNFTLTSLSTPTVGSSRNQEQFAEPVAGPSGIKSRKLVLLSHPTKEESIRKDLVNGDNNSDSGDSTSGYSSMARVGVSKELIVPNVEKPKENLRDSGERLTFSRTCKYIHFIKQTVARIY